MASTTSNITITEMPYLSSQIAYLGQATTSHTFAPGDLIEADSYAASVAKVVDSADKSAFVGVCFSCIIASDVLSKVGIAVRCVIKALLVSGATHLYFGEAAAWSTGANGTDWSFANTSTEAVAYCIDREIGDGDYGSFLMDSFTLRSVTGFSFWEVPA